MAWIRRNWKWVAPLSVAGVAVGIWLVFGWLGLHTLFFDQTVDEAAPTFATTTTQAPVAADDPTASIETAPADNGADDPNSTDPAPTTTSTIEDQGPATFASGTFIGRSHPTSGSAIVLGGGSGQRVLCLEGFETDNGPDLFVYLSTAPADAPAGEFDDDFVDLGVLKGNVGNQNYEIPQEVDLDRYVTVVIWCRRFSVAFGAADLEA